ncbi:hypothetical protein KM043_017100 [Ampulex compressa]|nr:hypothetical protein KM043_017100 [Ampulex compressa]
MRNGPIRPHHPRGDRANCVCYECLPVTISHESVSPRWSPIHGHGLDRIRIQTAHPDVGVAQIVEVAAYGGRFPTDTPVGHFKVSPKSPSAVENEPKITHLGLNYDAECNHHQGLVYRWQPASCTMEENRLRFMDRHLQTPVLDRPQYDTRCHFCLGEDLLPAAPSGQQERSRRRERPREE